jgi:hypothetical protein
VRATVAHTLTLRAAVSVEFVSPASVPYPPVLGTGTFDLQRASGQETVQDSVGTETLVFLRGRIFDRRPPAEAAGLPHGRPWIRVDFNEQLKGPFMSQFLLRLEQRDPGFLLAEVAWGARTAAPLGPRTIGGVQTTGYLVDVRVAEAAAAASGPRARGFVRTAGFVQQTLGGRGATQVIRLWVDQSHRVVSVRTSTIGTGGGTTLMTLTSFGTPVRLSPPAGSETVDLAAVVGLDLDHD